MPSPFYAREYTPELSSSVLAGQLNLIDQSESDEEGRARKEALAGGLEGTAEMGSKVGYARANADNAKLGLLGNWDATVAGKQYGERMTDEGQSFQASEAQKSRDLQEKLAEMGYQWGTGEGQAERGQSRVTGQQGLVTGKLLGLAAKGVGAYFGGPVGAAAASAVMDKITDQDKYGTKEGGVDGFDLNDLFKQ